MMQDSKEKAASHDFHPPKVSNLDSEPEDVMIAKEIDPSGKIANDKSDPVNEIVEDKSNPSNKTLVKKKTHIEEEKTQQNLN